MKCILESCYSWQDAHTMGGRTEPSWLREEPFTPAISDGGRATQVIYTVVVLLYELSVHVM